MTKRKRERRRLAKLPRVEKRQMRPKPNTVLDPQDIQDAQELFSQC